MNEHDTMTRQRTAETRTAPRDERHDLIASNRVEGTAVYGRDGSRIGTIDHFMVGKRSGQVEYAVMGFGGFLGMGKEHRPVPWGALDYEPSKGGYVLPFDESKLKDSPSFERDREPEWDRSYGQTVYGYYGLIY